MVLKELLSSANLAKTQTLCIHKIIEILIISKNQDLVFAAFQVVAPCLEGFNNNKDLTIMRFIPNFNRYYLSKEKGY